MMQQMELLKKGYKEPAGNIVVIKHTNGEYSNYLHLKPGSVQVKAGDQVKQGQVIGKVGHSGNSTEPHLHFQVTDGEDPMYSRGIPVKFKNVSVEGLGYEDRMLQTGWIVTTK
jgi:murein DD-endopeptidase MepM/ murein hydrolase activator NlpD